MRFSSVCARVLQNLVLSGVGLWGGSVKAAGLGDGAKPKTPSAVYEVEQSTIAKLPLDAATRMPGYFPGRSQADKRDAGRYEAAPGRARFFA